MALERIFSGLNISATGLSAQRQRMNTISQNIANAETTRTDEGGPYRRQYVVTAEAEPTVFKEYFQNKIRLEMTSGQHFEDKPYRGTNAVPSGTRVAEVAMDNSPPRLVYDPTHPDADENGYVAMPNVNAITEMVDMITASRAYEANLSALDAGKQMSQKAMDI